MSKIRTRTSEQVKTLILEKGVSHILVPFGYDEYVHISDMQAIGLAGRVTQFKTRLKMGVLTLLPIE